MMPIVASGLNTKLSQGIASAQGADAMARPAHVTAAAASSEAGGAGRVVIQGILAQQGSFSRGIAVPTLSRHPLS